MVAPEIRTHLAGMMGKAPQASLGEKGTELRLRFGPPEERDCWTLYLKDCRWRVDLPTETLFGSEDDPALVTLMLQSLDWGVVHNAGLFLPALDMEVRFSSQVELKIFSSSTDPFSIPWMLASPTGLGVMQVWGTGHCAFIKGEEIPDVFSSPKASQTELQQMPTSQTVN